MSSGQSTAKIEELLLEDQNVKRRRERYQKQSSLLSKLTRQLSIHDNRAADASGWSNGSAGVYARILLNHLHICWVHESSAFVLRIRASTFFLLQMRKIFMVVD